MKACPRFLRHRGIYRSDGVTRIVKSRGGMPPPVGRPRSPAKGRDGRSAPCSSSAMSSGRLFLDRVARQHCPSPLHRQLHPKTVLGWGTMNLQRTANSVLTLCLSQGDNRTPKLYIEGAGDAPLHPVACLPPRASRRVPVVPEGALSPYRADEGNPLRSFL